MLVKIAVFCETISFPPKDSDVSAADPDDILKNMKVGNSAAVTLEKISSAPRLRGHGAILCPLFASAQDMDDMDADLFGSKKKPSAQTRPLANDGSRKGSPAVKSEAKPEGAGNLLCFCAVDSSPRH